MLIAIPQGFQGRGLSPVAVQAMRDWEEWTQMAFSVTGEYSFPHGCDGRDRS